MKYVTERIRPLEMANWGNSSKIFIDAPMGSGKSHFVITQLTPRALRQGKSVLILCNRANLRDAYLQEFADCFSDWLNLYLQHWVVVETYQSLAKMSNASLWIERFPVIVCDEVHAFYSDSTFAPEMYKAYRNIILGCRNSLTVFMSATSKCIFPQIQFDLQQNGCISYPNNWAGGEQFPNLPGCYTIAPDFTYLDVHYAQSVDQIINVILRDQKSLDKWLILVPSINEGKSIKKSLLKDGYGNGMVFFLNGKNSSTNGASIKEDLTLAKSFNVKILITTSIIEAGISINDGTLRNIVDLHFNKETFIQSLGRKRVSDGERVNLYLMNRNQGFFSRKQVNSQQAWDECKCIDIRNSKNYHNVFTNLLSQSGKTSWLRTYTYFQTCCCGNGDYKTEPMVNPFSVKKLQDDNQFFTEMIANLSHDSTAYLRCQMEWLGLDYDSGIWLNDEDISQENHGLYTEMISQKLKVYANAGSMSKDTFTVLRKEIAEILHEFMPKKYRADRTIGINSLNKVLVKLDIPFVIDTTRTSSATKYKIVPIVSSMQD